MELTNQNKKHIGIVAIGALITFIIYYTSKDKSSSNTVDDIDPTGNGTSPVNNTAFDAKKVSNNIYSYVKDVVSDEAALLNELTRINQQQFGLVVKAFGKKAYNLFSGNSYFLMWQTPTYYDLKTILKSELSSKDYALYKQKYPMYL